MQRRIVLAAMTAALSACGTGLDGLDPTEGGKASDRYDVTITRTALGIPHISAHKEGDFGSLGYGYGYAQAEDNLCVLMDDIVTINGQRARYFGADGGYTIYANDAFARNVDSDFFWKAVATDAAIAPMKQDMLEAAVAGSRGFAEGFNRYVRELKAGQHPGRHAACRDGAWLREITFDDMIRRYFRLGILASSSVFVNDVANAKPPVAGVIPASVPVPTAAQVTEALGRDRGALKFFDDRSLGSNMYAIGKDLSATGMPIVFGNPHFPWRGTERLYLAHLTVPGLTDIMGVGLYGVPLALIGFNEHFAWSHTVSTAYRFAFYELTLVPGDPTRYIHEGAVVKMQELPITIDVLQEDGSVVTQTRTLYRSHYGPMLGLTIRQGGQDVNIFPWSTSKAYTLRDGNAENTRLINHFFRWNTARSLDEFKQIQRETVAVPWVNTVASGPGGKAYYADITNVPNVTDEKAQQCVTSAQGQAIGQLLPGLYVLDGSRAACDWGTDADAPVPGIFGAGNLPSLERDDWVGNFNDSYWLTNPAEPITGYDLIIGPEETARSLRTRNGIVKQLDRAAGADGLPGNRWTTEQLKQSVLDSHIYSADLGRDAVVEQTCALGTVMTQSGPTDVSGACAVLAAWDKSNNLDSVGGHVWREFWRNAQGANGFYLTPFSASDPVHTPRDVNALSPEVQRALGDAVNEIGAAGIALDVRLGTIQHAGFDPSIEIFGGEGNMEGAFTIANSEQGGIGAQGYPVTFGNSYMQVVTWETDGTGFTPVADAFLTYSLSTDPASPHYNDFTKQYSMKAWKRLPFRAADVKAERISEIRLKD